MTIDVDNIDIVGTRAKINAEAMVDAINTEIAALPGVDLSAIEQDISDAQQDISDLESEVGTGVIAALVQDVSDAEDDIAALQEFASGKLAYGVLRIANPVLDGETVRIGDDVYEFDTDAVETITVGNIRVDLSSAGTASEGTLTVDTNPSVGDTMTIGTTVYTFVPNGTANAAGEIDVEALLADTQANIEDAVNGDDGFNDPHPLVTIGAFAADAAVITAITPGTAGDLIATTETFSAGTNVFDAATLGTTTAGADPVAADATTALAAAINASATEAVKAARFDDNTILVMAEEIGAVVLDLAETMTGVGCAWDAAAMAGGEAVTDRKIMSGTHVPTAAEVSADEFFVPVAFDPSVAFVRVGVTATGVTKLWNGGAKIVPAAAGVPAYVAISNAGTTDWDLNDTVHYIFVE